MNPVITHGLANGALLGGAMGLSGVGSLTATIVGNVLFLAFALAATVSALALVADHAVEKRGRISAIGLEGAKHEVSKTGSGR